MDLKSLGTSRLNQCYTEMPSAFLFCHLFILTFNEATNVCLDFLLLFCVNDTTISKLILVRLVFSRYLFYHVFISLRTEFGEFRLIDRAAKNYAASVLERHTVL